MQCVNTGPAQIAGLDAGGHVVASLTVPRLKLLHPTSHC
jgi:hypothetical protein